MTWNSTPQLDEAVRHVSAGSEVLIQTRPRDRAVSIMTTHM